MHVGFYFVKSYFKFRLDRVSFEFVFDLGLKKNRKKGKTLPALARSFPRSAQPSAAAQQGPAAADSEPDARRRRSSLACVPRRPAQSDSAPTGVQPPHVAPHPPDYKAAPSPALFFAKIETVEP